MEEIAGDLLQNQRFQAPKVEETKAQSLRHGRQERRRRIGPFEFQQAAQEAYPAPIRLPDQRRHIRVEQRIMAPQQGGFRWWCAIPALRVG